MPWCPKCKMEFYEGITVCSDCNTELVEKLEEEKKMVPCAQFEEEQAAKKLLDFLTYSKLEATLNFDEELQEYILSVPEKKQKEAAKLFKAFAIVENEKRSNQPDTQDMTALNEDIITDELEEELLNEPVEDQENFEDNFSEEGDTEFDEDTENSPSDHANMNSSYNYVMKSEQFKDLYSTVWLFLFFGLAGIIVVILNVVGVLHFFSGILPNTVMSALFIFFIIVGITSYQKAKKVQSEIDCENKLTDEINEWLKTNITVEFLSSIHDDDKSDELNYLHVVETVKKMLDEKFGKQNPAYYDRIFEEFYSNNFEN